MVFGAAPDPCLTGVERRKLRQVAESDRLSAQADPAQPLVLRGVARHWPALQRWTFKHLAELGGDRPITLVLGNREQAGTRMARSTFSAFMAQLDGQSGHGRPGSDSLPHLKEFDLLQHLRGLAEDIHPRGLFPPGHAVSSSVWTGPKGAHTGLHRDLPDNLAVLLRGAKRFYLARPGTVESIGGVSAKHDRWAVLAKVGMRDLVDRAQPPGSLLYADLAPGDAIHVPRDWWHEVVNLQASVFLSGFHGSWPRMLRLLLATGARQALHGLNVFTPRDCTCHAAGHGWPR